MAKFRDRRITLLVLALILSGLFIFAPWKGANDEGAPMRNIVKGPNWGIDITGGSRIMLKLTATHATIDLPKESSKYAENLITRFRKRLESPITSVVQENIEKTGELKIEIGKKISENKIRSLLENGEELIGSPKEKVSQKTQDKVKNSLKTRVDPYGTLGAQFKPMGDQNQFLLFEVSLDLDRAKRLLGEEGLPEVFIENQRVVWSEHLRNVERSYSKREGTWGVSFKLNEEGRERFAKYSDNKEGHPGVIYLDRPNDSILMFSKDFMDTFKSQVEDIRGDRIQTAKYSERLHRIRLTVPDEPNTDLNERHPFYIPIPTVQIEDKSLSEPSKNYIGSLIENEEIDGGILFGKKKSYSELLQNDNLIVNNKSLPVENYDQMSESERYLQWFNRVTGLESWPTLQPSITGNPKAIKNGLRISTGSGEAGKKQANDLRIILSQSLPVEVSHISETEIGGRLSSGFVREAAIAGVVAFLVVGIMVFSFYRKFKVAIPLLLTMTCEVVITFGVVSAIPDGLMSIGLPGLGGLIAVVGTGVDHQIIITDEVLSEESSGAGRAPIDRRTGRAFSVIFAAAATTVAAMFALAAFGFGAMRGFAIVSLSGVLISVLITRPAYAQIIGALMEREHTGG